ncbi:hypothetical protein BaRGS_00022665, partial [Batillaria attramentaria]
TETGDSFIQLVSWYARLSPSPALSAKWTVPLIWLVRPRVYQAGQSGLEISITNSKVTWLADNDVDDDNVDDTINGHENGRRVVVIEGS